MFSAGEGIACPKCLRLTDTPGSEEDQQAAENAKLGILEQKLQESESKLEATVVVRQLICFIIYYALNSFISFVHCAFCKVSVKKA